MTQVIRPFRGISADERRRTRRVGLLDACYTIAAAQRMMGTTVDAICAEAGLSKRYFYESFRNRDELFAALIDTLIAEITDAVISSLSSTAMPLLTRVHAGIERVVAILTDDPRKAKVYVDVVGNHVHNGTVDSAEQRLAGLLVQLVLADTDSTPAQRQRLNLVALILVVGTARAVTAWLDGDVTLSRHDLVDEIAQMAVAAARTVRPDL
ncbi:TetR/AcrR family transcriptional regulator [Antrihabitans cavernicola]|uniref:TetR/AcrR family transcriptional regulator n=1 Tax=Antrihabitans cavernicola TaxID=2495913 RepID=UPI0016593543|nr:TetR/AcrR family transcriptional regulator [Spelaeibacter cavernicola]